MASLRDLIYRHCPYTLQNCLISAYGFYLRSIRHNRYYLQTVRLLEEADTWPPEKILAEQARLLNKLVMHAVQHVPYYMEKYGTVASNWGEIHPGEISKYFSVLDKEVVKKFSSKFVSLALKKHQKSTIFTSGTTGSPLQVTASKTAIANNFAFFSHFLQKIGLDPFAPSATFAGRLIVPQDQEKPPFWRYNYATKTWLFSSYHINLTNIPHYIAHLETICPTFIDSYPSSIYSIAKYINKNKLNPQIRPQAIVTSSETLMPHQREEIEQAFLCRVHDQYGCAEMSAFIYQCTAGSYHSHPLYGLIEVVGQDGLPCQPGQPGDLVLTGFINEGMPLIRYRIGDQAILRPGQCPCGSAHPMLESILGREDDYIVTPEGNQVGRLDPLFKGLYGIMEAQIVQERVEHITLLVVANEQFDQTAQFRLLHNLRERLGKSIAIEIRKVDAIPRTQSGKFRSVLSFLSGDSIN